MKLFLSLKSIIFYIANIGVWKYGFARVIIKIKFFHSCCNRVVLVAIALHSYLRSCFTVVTRAALVLHSHRCYCLTRATSCCTCVTMVLLVSHSCRTHVASACHSWCKIVYIIFTWFINILTVWSIKII